MFQQKKYLVHIDILGFGPLLNNIADNIRREPEDVRADFKNTINKKIDEAKNVIPLDIIDNGIDDWTLAINSFNETFFVISNILDHYTGYKDYKTVPLEIAIGVVKYPKWANKEGLSYQNKTINYLKSDLIKEYHNWYKREYKKKYVTETYIVITEPFFRELLRTDQINCISIPYNNNFFYSLPQGIIEREKKINEFLKRIEHEKSDFSGALIDRIYIPPEGYKEIEEALKRDRIVFITGTAGYGKTYTTIKLLWEYFNNDYIPKWIPGTDKLDRRNVREKLVNIDSILEPGHIIYFEDPFGKTEYEGHDNLKERINHIISIVKNKENVYVIITSRKDVFKQFERENYSVEEIHSFEKELNILKPSYTSQKRKEMLKCWAIEKGCNWLEDNELECFVLKSIENKEKLPTPLSIYDFVEGTIKTIDKKELNEKIHIYSGNVGKAFADEIIGLYESGRKDRVLFLSLIFISETFEVDFIKEEYEKLMEEKFEDFEDILEEEYRVKERSFNNEKYLEFSHPSYLESINHFLTNPACKKIFWDVSKNFLDHEYSYVQWGTAEALGKIGDRKTTQLLIDSLNNPNKSLQSASSWALGEIGDPKAVPPLIKILDSSDFTVRRASIIALGKIGDPRAVKHLIKNLNRSDFSSQKASAEALGRIGDLKSVPYLIEKLNGPDWAVQLKSIEALGNIGDPRAVTHLIKLLEDPVDSIRKKSMHALEKIGEPSVKPLIENLNHISWSTQNATEKELIEIIKPLLKYIIPFLEDPDQHMRKATVHALKVIEDPSTVEPLIKILKDQYLDIRRDAVLALGKIKDPKAVPHLIKYLKDEDYIIKSGVITALGMIKDPDAVEPLIEILNDANGLKTIKVLGEIGDQRAVKPLVNLILQEGFWNKRGKTAFNALKKLKCSKITLFFIEALKDSNENVRLNASEALGRIKDPKAVEPLLEALKDSEIDFQLKVIEALGEIGDKKAVPCLIKFLKNGKWYIQRDAAEALGKIGDKKAAKPLVETLQKPNTDSLDEVMDALGKIGDLNTVEPIMDYLKGKDNEFKKIMMWTLITENNPKFSDRILDEIDKELEIDLITEERYNYDQEFKFDDFNY
nr:HEAT repeat domain-containing protein [uncultured Methanobacterium sp.]